MINKVQLNNIAYTKPMEPATKPAFKSSIKQEALPELNGLNAQAIYMSYTVQKNPFAKELDIEEFPLISQEYKTENIQGERVYNSDGKLAMIIDDNREEQVVYYPHDKNPEVVDFVKVIDKETKAEKVVQENYFGANGLRSQEVVVKENSPFGDVSYRTEYDADGEVKCTSVMTKYKNGDSKDIFKYEDGYSICLASNDGTKFKGYEFDKDKNLINIDFSREEGTQHLTKRIYFYQDEVYKTSEYRSEINPDIKAEDIVDMDGAVPAHSRGINSVEAKAELQELLEDDNFEKTYFSNGAVETISLEDEVKITLTPLGEIKCVTKGDTEKCYIDNDGNEIIEEKFKDGVMKKTVLYVDDGEVFLQLIDTNTDNEIKSVLYNKDGSVRRYESGEKFYYFQNGALELES